MALRLALRNAFSRRAQLVGLRRCTTSTDDAHGAQENFRGYGVEKGSRYVNRQAALGAPKHKSKEGAKDWSEEYGTTGALFHQPKSVADWQNFRLSKEQVEQYWEDGYLSNVRVLSEEQCDALIRDYNLFLDEDNPHPGHGFFYEFHLNTSDDPNSVVLHTLGHWRITQLFHDLIYLPAIVVPSSQLIDPSRNESRVRLWHDQLFGKPANHGGVVAWHQDYSYWVRSKPMKHLTVHVALDDQTAEPDNGCLRFIPGSHRWHRDGMPLPITDDTFTDMDSIQKVLRDEEKAQFKNKPSLLKKGEASFHHPLTVHGSFSNHTPLPRRACVVNYIADGVVSDTDDVLLTGTPPMGKGQPITGQFFPLVYDPVWGSK